VRVCVCVGATVCVVFPSDLGIDPVNFDFNFRDLAIFACMRVQSKTNVLTGLFGNECTFPVREQLQLETSFGMNTGLFAVGVTVDSSRLLGKIFRAK